MLRPQVFSRAPRAKPVKFVEFNIVYESDGNAMAVGLGANEPPIFRAWWVSKN
jgi:hypothetical protein